MIKIRARVLVFAMVVGMSVLWVDHAGSQDQPKDAVAEAQVLFDDVETKGQELARVIERAQASGGEDADALYRRGADLVQEIVTMVDQLAANVVARQEGGEDATVDRDRVASLYGRTTEFLQSTIDRTRTRIRELRASRKDAAPEDLEEIENDIVAMNDWHTRSLSMLLDQIEHMEDLGLDVGEQRQFLADALEPRAELLAGRIMLRRDEIARTDNLLSVDPSNTELVVALETAKNRLDLNVAQLQKTSQMMSSLGLESAEYDQLLFEVTGDITASLFSKDVLAGVMASWRDSVVDWISDNGPTLVLRAVLFVLILFVFWMLARVARKVVAKALRSSNLEVSQLLERTALSLTKSVIMIIGFLVALSQLGIEVGPMLAGLGVAGFIVGFALQDTLSNFAAGAMILFYRPYDVGDLVETAGAFGKVKDMSLVSTTILTLDHQTLVIPNSKIWGDVIKNVTAQTKRRVDMVFGIGYADDIPQAEKVLKEILESHEKVLKDPEPTVKLHNLGESSVDFVVRPWAETDDYWDVFWDITREVKIRFDAEGISIPFPQRDVHLFQEGGSDGDE